jgi:hypothetical protein
MANQIVPLQVVTNVNGNINVSGVFWLVTPANNVAPYPQFLSQVPFIDQVTLSQLRAGTLTEQAFIAPTFPAGTTAATIQAQLQSLYLTAQAALTASASPVAGVIGTVYNGSAWVSTVSGPGTFDPVRGLISDASWASATGLIPGLVSGRATGYVSTSSASNKAIMATAYIPQGTNLQCSLVSTSSGDASGGTGAQQVLITYLDASFGIHQETITLNGTTPVNTVGVNYAYLESMVVVTVGSAQTNQGTISIYTGTNGSGSVWGSIAVNPTLTLAGTATTTNGSKTVTFTTAQTLPAGATLYFSDQASVGYTLASAITSSTTGTLTANFGVTGGSGQTVLEGVGDNQTFWCHHYVPAGVTCYIQSMEGFAYATMGVVFLTSIYLDISNAAPIQIGPTVGHPVGYYQEHDFESYLPVVGPSLIQLFARPIAATADTALGNFEFIQF